MARLYLDYNASTPIDPDVAATMRTLLADSYGNPSSGHWAAAPAKAALETARSEVAVLLGCVPDEIAFTSGGSEANNIALKGMCPAPRDGRAHIITSAIEHPAILRPCRYLATCGLSVTCVRVDGNGLVDPDDMRKAINAPFRETTQAISAAAEDDLLAVEMEAAALYAFAHARQVPVRCLAPVTNRMAQVEGDFEKGDADGSKDALCALSAILRSWRESCI